MDTNGGVEVGALATELARAVEITMDNHSSQQARMEAYHACERFKEVSPLCAQAGLYLVTGQYTSIVKHFGLQLIEHTIKFNWNVISRPEKIFIKENSMKLLNAGVAFATDASNVAHIKDALSRIIVEMIKREWPQQWTTLLSELSEACGKGEAQTEIVLLVFLRLVEDVALLQTIESNQRRKDIYQALTVNMSEIFEFFLRLIELHVGEFRNSTQMQNNQKALEHSRVVQVVLLTLSGFVEWVSINHIMAANGRLLHILCILLNDTEFQLPAAECLLQIVNRKGQLKDRKPLMLLFSDEAINYIYRSTNQPERCNNETFYQFLKKLGQVLLGLCSQLTTMWGKEDVPQIQKLNFITFLETIMLFTRHASLTLSHAGCLCFTSLVRNDQISKDLAFIEYIPKVIDALGPKIVKISYPKSRPTEITMHPQTFASIDYDSEDEFLVFFYRCRTDFLEMFRQSTLIAPLITFAYCEQWLTMRLQKSAMETNSTCSISDPVYLEWEAITVVLDGVLSRILLVPERPSVASGLRLLEECLKVDTRDPLVLSILLSATSSLFVFLSMSSCQLTSANCVAMTGVSLLPRVLEKIFAALVFVDPPYTQSQQGSEAVACRRKAVKNLRRHAASLMVKIAHKYPLLLLPIFDQINTTVQNLIRQPDQLSYMEQITMHEALLLISNHFCDYERQSSFIGEVIRSGVSSWLNLAHIIKTPATFIEFIGLNKYPAGTPNDDLAGLNRREIIYALSLLLGVIKRCSWPDDPDRASRGGFVVGLTESGNPICRNPATTHVVPLLPHVLSLLRVMNDLWTREAVSMVSEGYKPTYAMLESEKKNLLGISPVLVDPMDPVQKTPLTPVDRMQQFLFTIFDHSYHLMGAAGPSLGRDLYGLPGIADALISSAFSGLENVPDFRLRPIIRVFLKSFIYSCPPAFYESVLLPIFAHVGPFMLNHLTTRWQYITELYESGTLNDDSNDTQEVIEDMLNRTLSREYLDVLKVALVGGTCSDSTGAGGGDGGGMDLEDQSMDGTPHTLTRAAQSAMAAEVISELGGKLLRYPYTCTSIVMAVLSGLAWNDSNCSLKSTCLTGPIVRFLAAEQLLTASLASNVLIAVLQGLQLHGQHEGNQAGLITLGVQVYEIMRPKFPNILDVMQQIPNISPSDIQKLDEKISTTSTTKGNKIDKAKKDLFKKITGHLIGRNRSQLFRKEVKIMNLPPANLPSRNNSTAHINILDQDAGLATLFTSTTTHS